MEKQLKEIEWLVQVKYTEENKTKAVKFLSKMRFFHNNVTVEKMEEFISSFREKYIIGNIIVSRQFTNKNNCWYISYSESNSVSKFHVFRAESLEEAYIKLCLDLFRLAKIGEYKRKEDKN